MAARDHLFLPYEQARDICDLLRAVAPRADPAIGYTTRFQINPVRACMFSFVLDSTLSPETRPPGGATDTGLCFRAARVCAWLSFGSYRKKSGPRAIDQMSA